MADKRSKTEKFYTPEEVAKAVLKRAHELLKESSLFKSNTSHEVEAGEEPHNDEAEAPEYLANADIENSGAHGEKTKSKKAPGAGIEGADKDGDGDIDGDDAIEAQEEMTGEDLDGDGEQGEKPEHKAKIASAAKDSSNPEDKQDPKAAIKAATEEKPDAQEKPKMPPMAKSEKQPVSKEPKKLSDGGVNSKNHKGPEHKDIKNWNDKFGTKPSLKKFMLTRKMKKAGVPTADSRTAEKLSGAPAAPSPAEKIKAQPKLEMEKNKSVEKLMGIAPKAGK